MANIFVKIIVQILITFVKLIIVVISNDVCRRALLDQIGRMNIVGSRSN